MRIYRYPPRALAGDYIRAAAGLTVGLGVMLSVSPTPAIIAIFGGLTCIFGFFGYRTLQRHVVKVAVTDDEICNAGFRARTMAWSDLEKLKLRYYGTKKQQRGSSGFMQMTLAGGGASFSYESSLAGFRYIAWRAAKAIRENGGSVDPTSAGNLLAIGLDADGERPPPQDDEPAAP